MARNLSVFGSDNGLGRGVAANPFLMLHREVNRLFDDAFRSTPVPFDQSGETIVPQINVSETDKELRVTAELPGVSEKDIDVTVDGDLLTIRAEKKVERKEEKEKEKEKEKENYYFIERAYGTFQRTLRLPFSVDPGQVQAQFENGVLNVTLPKPQASSNHARLKYRRQKKAPNRVGAPIPKAAGRPRQLSPRTAMHPARQGVCLAPLLAENTMTAQTSTFAPRDVKPEGMNALLAQNWWAIGLRGLCGIIFGIIAFAAPGATILSLVFVFAAYMLVDGIFAIVAGARAARQHERWGLLVLEGIANIALAAIVTLWPGLTVLAFVLWVAAWSIISGTLMLGASFRLKMDHGRGWLAFGGIMSIIFGVLLAIAPLVGAIVLTWWLGAYALVFGAALIALSFQLRSRRNDATLAATATAI